MSAAEYNRVELVAIAALRDYDQARSRHSVGARPPVVWLDVAVALGESLRALLDRLQADEAQRAALGPAQEAPGQAGQVTWKDTVYGVSVIAGGLLVAVGVVALAYWLGVRP
jgi:hypothetical protein